MISCSGKGAFIRGLALKSAEQSGQRVIDLGGSPPLTAEPVSASADALFIDADIEPQMRSKGRLQLGPQGFNEGVVRKAFGNQQQDSLGLRIHQGAFEPKDSGQSKVSDPEKFRVVPLGCCNEVPGRSCGLLVMSTST